MRLETNGYYALGVPLYLAIAAVEHTLARRRGKQAYGFATTIGNLAGGLGEVVIGLFIGPVLILLYDFAFANFALVRWESAWITWTLAFFLGDFCYYVYHRAGHRIGALWAVHGVHHQGEELNLSVALRNPWFSDTYSAIFYLPLPLLGVPPEQFFIAITLISFYSLTIHTPLLHRPGFWLLTTPWTHQLHHAKNGRYLNKNFGAMFTIWDRLFGTHMEPQEEPVRFGTNWGYETHDGARSQWIFFEKLLHASRQGRTWRERLTPFFAKPGWLPPGALPLASVPARTEIPARVRLHVGVQFATIVTLALWVLWFRSIHPLWLEASASLLVLWGIATTGAMLDGRDSREAPRLFATLALALALASEPSYAPAALLVALSAIGGLVTLPPQYTVVTIGR